MMRIVLLKNSQMLMKWLSYEDVVHVFIKLTFIKNNYKQIKNM